MGTSFFACEVCRSWSESDENGCGVSVCSSCALTRDLVAALLCEPTGVTDLLSVHEAVRQRRDRTADEGRLQKKQKSPPGYNTCSQLNFLGASDDQSQLVPSS